MSINPRGEGTKQLGSFYNKDGKLYFKPIQQPKSKSPVVSIAEKIIVLSAVVVALALCVIIFPLGLLLLVCLTVKSNSLGQKQKDGKVRPRSWLDVGIEGAAKQGKRGIDDSSVVYETEELPPDADDSWNVNDAFKEDDTK